MRHETRSLVALAAMIASTLAVTGCGGGSLSGNAAGMLNLGITDAPVDDAQQVVVVFTGVELHRRDGQSVQMDFGGANKSIDLMLLQNGATADLLQGASVPAGEYNWMRLEVLADRNAQGESYILLDSGQQYPLWIPSGAETGLKLVRPFTVAQGSVTRLLVDFDLRKSVTAPPGQDPNYVLRPALRLLDQLQVGAIDGVVDLAALTSQQLGAGVPVDDCKAGVYLFNGAAVAPDDQDGNAADGADPVVYQSVEYDGLNTAVGYRIPFVEVGSYTLAATCNLDVDASPTDSEFDPTAVSGQPGYQTMNWSVVQDVAVTVDQTTTVDLPAAGP